MCRFLILICLLSSVAFGETLPTLDRVRRSDEAPVKIQATGQRESLEPLVNGKVHGKARYYHPNGQLYGVIEYRDGKKNGTHTLYRADGTREQELSFKDGQLEGVSRWFDDKGALTIEATYTQGRLVSKRNAKLPPAAAAPVNSRPKDPLNAKIEAAVHDGTPLADLIEIALKGIDERDNLALNIKARAYAYLRAKAETSADRAALKKHEARFLKDWKETKSDWLKSRSAAFILKLDPPKEERTKLILAVLGDYWLMGSPSERASEESRMRQLIHSLQDAPDPIATLAPLLSIMETKLPLSARLTDAALSVIDGWAPKFSQAEFDQIAQARFQFRAMVEAQRTQDPKVNSHTIWLFASKEEVENTLAHFDRTACLRPLKPGVKTWHYDRVLAGQSETQFQDRHERLTCGQ